MMQNLDYTKYRWFFTSSDKLVIGGKNSEQNEELVKKITKSGNEYLVLHTAEPGSPFSFVIANIEELKPADIEEAAIFTACFSQQWKKNNKKVDVDMFRTSQVYKNKKMDKGTFGVSLTIEKRNVEMKLFLTMQKGKLRAVPNPKIKILEIIPGDMEKETAAEEIQRILKDKNALFTKDEIMAALPARNIKIKKMKNGKK